MKKILAIVLSLMLLASFAAANAEGVVILTQPAFEENTTVSLDDVKSDSTVELDDAMLSFGEFEIRDIISIYGRGEVGSGNEAEFTVFYVDITNLAKTPVNFLKDIEVSVWYNDEYQFGGWAGQFDYDQRYADQVRDDEGEQFEINPLYEGHYAFVCPIPNFAVNGADPLKMVIKLLGNEFTYNIRK